MTDTETLAAQYRDVVARWGETPNRSYRAANRLFDRYRVLGDSLASSAEGRAAVERLMGDPDTAVRMVAATKALAWAEPEARAVLERIAGSGDRHALTAEMTLRKHDGLPLA